MRAIRQIAKLRKYRERLERYDADQTGNYCGNGNTSCLDAPDVIAAGATRQYFKGWPPYSTVFERGAL